jgi:hypothetical protein
MMSVRLLGCLLCRQDDVRQVAVVAVEEVAVVVATLPLLVVIHLPLAVIRTQYLIEQTLLGLMYSGHPDHNTLAF